MLGVIVSIVPLLYHRLVLIVGGYKMDFIATCLRNFECEDYKNPVDIDTQDGLAFYLLPGFRVFQGIKDSFDFKEYFGLDAVNRIKNNYLCFAYSEETVPDIDLRRVLTNNYFSSAQLLSNALWFIKDNSVSPYFTSISSDKAVPPVILRRNIYYSDSQGEYEDSSAFSVREVEEALTWFQELENFQEKRKIDDVDLSSDLQNMSSHLDFNVSSFQRAFHFLTSARTEGFLPAKVASYISALETLYGVKGENAHKTAERSAALVGENTEARIKVFSQVKEAYNIRSMYIHGSHFKETKNATLPSVSKNMDDILRKVFKKMLIHYKELNYVKDNTKTDKAFNEIVLSMR